MTSLNLGSSQAFGQDIPAGLGFSDPFVDTPLSDRAQYQWDMMTQQEQADYIANLLTGDHDSSNGDNFNDKSKLDPGQVSAPPTSIVPSPTPGPPVPGPSGSNDAAGGHLSQLQQRQRDIAMGAYSEVAKSTDDIVSRAALHHLDGLSGGIQKKTGVIGAVKNYVGAIKEGLDAMVEGRERDPNKHEGQMPVTAEQIGLPSNVSVGTPDAIAAGQPAAPGSIPSASDFAGVPGAAAPVRVVAPPPQEDQQTAFGRTVAAAALDSLREPYTYGSEATLVQNAFHTAGRGDFPALAADQLNQGRGVPFSAAQPGDLVARKTPDGYKLLGVYTGNNKFVAGAGGQWARRDGSEFAKGSLLGVHVGNGHDGGGSRNLSDLSPHDQAIVNDFNDSVSHLTQRLGDLFGGGSSHKKNSGGGHGGSHHKGGGGHGGGGRGNGPRGGGASSGGSSGGPRGR